MKYLCKNCGRLAAYLLEDGSGPCCFCAEPVGPLPKMEKASFTNDINARRAQIRRQKRGAKKRAVVTVPRRIQYFRNYHKNRRAMAA